MFLFLVDSFSERAADQEQYRRQTCLPEGLSAEFAGCEALRASRPADGIRSALSRERSDLDKGNLRRSLAVKFTRWLGGDLE